MLALSLLISQRSMAAPDGEAQESAKDPQYTTVVTGKLGPEPLYSADRSISVVDKKALRERAPRTVPEALWEAPGVYVQQTNHAGGSPMVRGMIGPQVLLVVDGVRLSNSTYRTGPMQYLNLIDPFSISRIEVLRGAGSLLYGSDAMGGVIQAIPVAPRDARGSPGFDGGVTFAMRRASADSGQTLHGHGDLGYGGLSVLGGVSYQQLGNLRGGGDVGEQVYSGYRAWYENFAATYRFSDGLFKEWQVKVAYLMAHIEDAGRTDKLQDKKSLSIYDNEDHLLYGRLDFRARPLQTRGQATLSYQHFFERKDGFSMGDDLYTKKSGTRDEVTAATVGADLRLNTHLLGRRLRLRYGGMIYHDMVEAGRQKAMWGQPWSAVADQSYPDGSTYDTYGLYLHLEGDPLRSPEGHIVRLGAGYRLHGMAGAAPAMGTLPEVDFSGLGHVALASAQYLYLDQVNVALTFSQGFRAPNLQEAVMLGDTGKFFHVPNADLGPERADTLELLARGRIWRVRLAAAGYITWLHDLIKRVPSTHLGEKEVAGKDVYRNENGGEGLLYGVEGRVSVEIGWGLSLSGHLTYTWGEEEELDGSLDPLSRIPPLFGQVKLRYDMPQVWHINGFVELFVRAAGDQTRLSVEDIADARIPAGGTDGWWTLNLRLGASVFDWMRVGFTLENMLDADYKVHGSGIYEPGINAVLGLSGSW